MPAVLDPEKIPRVSETDPMRLDRGQRLKEWIETTDGVDIAALARQAVVSRQTVYHAFEGVAAEKTYDKLEAAQRHMIEHPDDIPDEPSLVVEPSTDEGQIEIELTDVYGIGRIVARGHESSDLVDSVVEIVRKLRENKDRE